MNRRNPVNVESDSEAVEKRPTRIPVGMRPKLAVVGKDPAYAYRFVNDTPGRIDMFKQGGWELVTNQEVDVGGNRAEESSAIGSHANVVVDGGNGMRAYVMKIKKEWFLEDQAAQAEYVDSLERDQLSVNVNDGEYGSIKIDRSGRK